MKDVYVGLLPLAIVEDIRFSSITISGLISGLLSWNNALFTMRTSSVPSLSLRVVLATWISLSTSISISSRMKSFVNPAALRFSGFERTLLSMDIGEKTSATEDNACCTLSCTTSDSTVSTTKKDKTSKNKLRKVYAIEKSSSVLD